MDDPWILDISQQIQARNSIASGCQSLYDEYRRGLECVELKEEIEVLKYANKRLEQESARLESLEANHVTQLETLEAEQFELRFEYQSRKKELEQEVARLSEETARSRPPDEVGWPVLQARLLHNLEKIPSEIFGGSADNLGGLVTAVIDAHLYVINTRVGMSMSVCPLGDDRVLAANHLYQVLWPSGQVIALETRRVVRVLSWPEGQLLGGLSGHQFVMAQKGASSLGVYALDGNLPVETHVLGFPLEDVQIHQQEAYFFNSQEEVWRISLKTWEKCHIPVAYKDGVPFVVGKNMLALGLPHLKVLDIEGSTLWELPMSPLFVKFSPNGQYLAVLFPYFLGVYQGRTGKVMAIRRHSGSLLEWATDQLLVSCDRGGTLRVWNFEG